MKNESKDLSELIEEWRRENRVNCMEGTRGVDQLTDFLRAIGYGDGNYFNDVIRNFLYDNSGAIESLIEWIGERNEQAWVENLISELPEEEEEPEEDTE